MIRFLRILFLVGVAIALIVVALANRSFVEVKMVPDAIAGLLPMSTAVEVPLFFIIFASILMGLLIGFVWEYLREYKIRRDAAQKERQVVKLEKEVEVLRKKSGQGHDDVLALIE